MIYFLTYASGFQRVIEEYIKIAMTSVEIVESMDGAILIRTDEKPLLFINSCFNNVFLVLDKYKIGKEHKNPIDLHLQKLIKKYKFKKYLKDKNIKQTFRIIASYENRLISINKNLKNRLEEKIQEATGYYLNRSDANIEFWILFRNEGISLFLKRLTKHKSYEHILEKGELHPEIAYLLVWMSKLQINHKILDPFCGSGSIPIQCVSNFNCKQVYAFDNDKSKIESLKNKLKTKNISMVTCKQIAIDQLTLIIGNETIDRIITDPPWGLFNDNENIEHLYNTMLHQFYCVIKTEGIIVILTACKQLLIHLIKEHKGLEIIDEFSVLISGKKAGVFIIKKVNKY